jgi:N-methylhydantoinase A
MSEARSQTVRTGYRLGIDVGGTYTDFHLVDENDGRTVDIKVPTTPEAPAKGIVAGIEELRRRGFDPAKISYVVHGTTLGLNALIQRRGARIGLLVTRGFRDILELGRLRIPIPFDFHSHRSAPLVSRDHVIEVDERLIPDGVRTPLSEDECARALDQLDRLDVDSVVIGLLHSYRDPVHERQLEDYLHARCPDLDITSSHRIWPQMREYERVLVAVMNAFISPMMGAYFSTLQDELEELGVTCRPHITRSNGGAMSLSSARERPIDTVLSGPAAGVSGAAGVAEDLGVDRSITFDMGGTSADISVLHGGHADVSREEMIEDLPVVLPVVGVSAIGAGGGSIVSVDDLGILHVGPESAGADPGPVCFGRGGARPALTDAFVVLGWLGAESLTSGAVLDRQAALAAFGTIGYRLGLSPEAAAEAAVDLARANMFAELTAVLQRKGIDPRDFALQAFGGAGPVMGALLADEVGIARVVVPGSPGTLCASGAVLAPLMSDFVRTVPCVLDGHLPEDIEDVVRSLESEGTQWLAEQSGAPGTDTHNSWVASCRYVGQAHEIDIEFDPTLASARDPKPIVDRFHERHEELYAHADHEAAVEMVELRLRVSREIETLAARTAVVPRRTDRNPSSVREMVFSGWRGEVAVFGRESLAAGERIVGPAVIEQADATVVVPPNWAGTLSEEGHLVLEKGNN